MVEGHVPQGVEVQVLSSALVKKIPMTGDFLFELFDFSQPVSLLVNFTSDPV